MQNQFTFTGRIGREPDLRISASGVSWLSLSVATDVYRGKEKESDTIWLQVKAFGALAEKLADLAVGTPILVAGTVDKVDTWQANTGEARATMVVIAKEVSVSLFGRGTVTYQKGTSEGSYQGANKGSSADADFGVGGDFAFGAEQLDAPF